MRRVFSRIGKFQVAIYMIAYFCLYSTAYSQSASQVCEKPVYLTFDTGHMGTAPLIADVLKRHHVKATFFAANERTKTGDGSLGDAWAPWWKARAAEGHEFASHTFDHSYWRGDVPSPVGGTQFKIRPSAGPQEGKESVWTGAQYCEELTRSPCPWLRARDSCTCPASSAAVPAA